MQLVNAYLVLIERQRVLLKLIGCDRFDPNYTMVNPLLIFMAINAAFYYFVNAYSMIKFSDEMVQFAYCLVTYGIGILVGQCGDKLRTYIFNKETLPAFHKMLKKFHMDNENLSHEIQEEVHRQIIICGYIIKGIAIMYYFGGTFITLTPFVLMSITSQEKLLLFGFVLPGIDYTTSPGYEINIAFQFLQVYYVVVGANVTDEFYVMLLMHARMQLNVIIKLLKELNTLVVQGADKLEIERLFYDIIEKHKLHLELMRQMEQNFSNHFFVLIVTVTCQMVLTLFVLVTRAWFAGIPLLLQAEVQLFTIAFLGAMISISSDEYEREIYNVAWYEMELKQKKNILILLQMSQSPIKLSFGGLGAFNLHAFLEINKSIYSSLMVFLSFA